MHVVVHPQAISVTAISSFRPLSQSREIARNQIRAKDSWERVFDRIIYFGRPDPNLWSTKTEFIDTDDYPAISALCMAAFMSRDMACIINADIVLAETFPVVIEQCLRHHYQAMTSARYEFDPNAPNFDNAKVVDHGFDVFIAPWTAWWSASRLVPETLRIAHAGWDNWILGYLNTLYGRRFVSISSKRCVFHPRHGDRRQPYQFEMPQDRYSQAGVPPLSKV